MSNSIWKTPDQKPEPDAGRWIYEKPSPIFPYGVSYRHTITAGHLVNAEWAYVDDLIAQADKAERLQKAVDLALNWLHTIATAHHPTTTYYNLDAQTAIDEIKQLIKGETDVE